MMDGTNIRSSTDLLAGQATSPSNILRLVPSVSPLDTDACSALLSGECEDVAVLCVEFTRSPLGLLPTWSQKAPNTPKICKIISVGGQSESAAAGIPSDLCSSVDIATENISSPGNLTTIGVEITETLARWEQTQQQLLFCFHSLTPLLQYVDFDRAYRFVHLITRQMSRRGILAHYHLDPSAHDHKTVTKSKTVVDTVVDVDHEGGTNITTY